VGWGSVQAVGMARGAGRWLLQYGLLAQRSARERDAVVGVGLIFRGRDGLGRPPRPIPEARVNPKISARPYQKRSMTRKPEETREGPVA
jgi:hypothetical protein